MCTLYKEMCAIKRGEGRDENVIHRHYRQVVMDKKADKQTDSQTDRQITNNTISLNKH